MAGIAGENLVFPVLDLMEQFMKKQSNLGDLLGGGYPSINLFREHELDEYRVTRALLIYDTGYELEVQMTFGSEDESTYPTAIEEAYFDYEYYRYFRLTEVTLVFTQNQSTTVATYHIVLNYEERGLLISTNAVRIL